MDQRELSPREALDRHALVTTVWLALGLAAAACLHHGLGAGGVGFTAAGFVVLLAAFAGHVIVNAAYATTFAPRELALGLVVYAAGLLAFGFAVLVAPIFPMEDVLALTLGFLALGAAVVFYMVTHFGLRRVFDAFDVVRGLKSAPGRQRRRR